MARDTESIERDIERAREQLAATLDQLGERADPRKLAEQAQQSVVATVTKPPVLAAAAGVAVVVALVVVSRFKRGRREKEIIRALAEGRISL
ncbi:hypothetical protein TPB0596_31340 [Tsukamurella pulmonis]|uniref:DUF3618 domain-containing protein n=2 Tax=Tsukamurella TaxID=2060 RepID=A0A5C5RGV0_9ACTN|nr:MULTISPECIES: DUF3618 domain-containing protein [Tsukamurella]KXO92341.1 hypothetical protein AXK56_04530 [Tsukamurella pulmonis]KXP09147.1 hypothetical protein AXK57_15265 [Tsukamurella pulmonis]RDH10435.1 DUF3618 domain-containing protein [Tsukamurella pulmonis]TWS21844.1 DUF3618 domain-containing protein [Tsukamurella sputi]SDQ75604.1 Protein of unknown function [Tsukamurella pulmonis]